MYYLVSDFLIPVQSQLDAAQQPKSCFTFQLFANQNQPITPNREKCRCHKNPKWTVPCKINIFCYDFEFRKMYRLHSTTQNQRYFYAISDVTRYFGSLFWIKSCAICEGLNVLEGPPKRVTFLSSSCAQKSCAFCEGLNVLGDKKSVIFVQFWHRFRFCTKGKSF